MADLSFAEQRVQKYLEEQIKDDDALRTLYAPSRIKDCFRYITEQAKAQAVAGAAFVDDAEVWKWARDYFLEVLPKEAEQKPVELDSGDAEKTAETEAETELPEDEEITEADNENEGIQEEEAGDCGAETELPEDEEITEADNENAHEIQYDEEGNGLLFDF